MKRIAFLAEDNSFSFLSNIYNYFNERYEARIADVSKKESIEDALLFADTLWIEWTANIANFITNLPKKHRIICRLHSYEAYLPTLQRINWNNVDKLIYISEQIRNYVEGNNPQLKNFKNAVTISEGVNPDLFEFRQRAPGLNFAFIGRLIMTKNISLLLQIIKYFADINPNYKFHIFGEFSNDGGMSPEIPKRYFIHQVIKLGIKNNIVMHGHLGRDELLKKLNDVNYIISTSYREGLPFNILEGMALGIKPLIHGWPGAEVLFPGNLIFNYIGDLKSMVENDYNSITYREFVEQNHNLKNSLPVMEKHVTGVL